MEPPLLICCNCRFAFRIQGCRKSFFALTRRFASFWKHCIRKSLTTCLVGMYQKCKGLRITTTHGRRAIRKRRAVILDNPEQRWHWVQLRIGRFSLEQFDHHAADAPYVACCCRTTLINHFWCHPIWTPHHSVIVHRPAFGCHTEVREFDGAILVCQDVRPFDVSMDHTLVV